MMMSITLLRVVVGSTSSSGVSGGGVAEQYRVVLRFKVAQLLHKIADYGYLEGDVVGGGEAATSKRLLQDVVQEGNAARIMRILDLAYECVVGFLSPLTDSAIAEEERDDVPVSRAEYVVTLLVGGDFTKGRVDRLETYIHNYLLFYALYHWLSLTNASAAGKWQAAVEALEEDIRDVRFVGGMYHRPYRPF